MDCKAEGSCLNNEKGFKRVLIYADESGRQIRKTLQRLLGDNFKVTALLKPYATVEKILETCVNDCSDFTDNDFVIILISRSNRASDLSTSTNFLEMLKTTNVLISDNLVNELYVFCNMIKDRNSKINSFEVVFTFNLYIHRLETCRSIWRAIIHKSFELELNKKTEVFFRG